jgi:hypothetical protein
MAHHDNRASAQDPRLTIRLDRGMWVHNLNGTHKTRARAGIVTDGGTAVALRGQG